MKAQFQLGAGGQSHALAALPPGERPGTYCTGGWLGPCAGLDGCRKSRPHPPPRPDSTPGPSSPQRFATPNTISRPVTTNINSEISGKILGKKKTFTGGTALQKCQLRRATYITRSLQVLKGNTAGSHTRSSRVSLTLRRLMSYIYIYIWSTHY